MSVVETDIFIDQEFEQLLETNPSVITPTNVIETVLGVQIEAVPESDLPPYLALKQEWHNLRRTCNQKNVGTLLSAINLYNKAAVLLQDSSDEIETRALAQLRERTAEILLKQWVGELVMITKRVMKQNDNQELFQEYYSEAQAAFFLVLPKLDMTKSPGEIVSYLRQKVRGAVLDYAGQMPHMGEVFYIRRLARSSRRIQALDDQNYGKEKDDDKIANELGVSFQQIEEARLYGERRLAINLDATYGENDDLSLHDIIPEQESEYLLNRMDLSDVLDCASVAGLNENEMYVLHERLTEGRTNLAIASELGVDHSRVSQIWSKAIIKIKNVYEIRYRDTA